MGRDLLRHICSTSLKNAKRRLNLDSNNSKVEPEDERFNKTPPAKRQQSNNLKSKKHKRSSTRSDASLGLLAKKFVSLLQNSSDGVVDLNIASAKLDVKKRRIYDVKQVLEGIGVLEKKSKNNVKWKGGQVSGEEYSILQREIASLDTSEKKLDLLLQNAVDNFKRMSEDKRYAYITVQDLERAGMNLEEDNLMAINAPAHMLLEVPRVDYQGIFRLNMKSTRGPIDVRVLQDLCTSVPTGSVPTGSKAATTASPIKTSAMTHT